MDEDKRISYFCLGLGIGVAVGILFAPKSGEETRQLLRSSPGICPPSFQPPSA